MGLHFSDRQFEIFERRQGAGLGALPITAGVIPINTRALVVVTFNETGVVKRVEVARFFDEPFVNDYWYILKEAAKDPMESLASLGESSPGFKAAGLDREAGTFTLEYPNSKARIAVKLDGQILRVTSRNPHHRLANEYRVYSKRRRVLSPTASRIRKSSSEPPVFDKGSSQRREPVARNRHDTHLRLPLEPRYIGHREEVPHRVAVAARVAVSRLR